MRVMMFAIRWREGRGGEGGGSNYRYFVGLAFWKERHVCGYGG